MNKSRGCLRIRRQCRQWCRQAVIPASEDVGHIVWAMVRGGVMLAHPGDAPEQFHGLFSIHDWQGDPHA